MISECIARIGHGDNHVLIPNTMILACSFVESMFNLPNGRLIVKISSSGIDEIYNMSSNIPIEIIVTSYEKNDASDLTDETIKKFKGTIVKHYTKNDEGFSDKTVYAIEFISIGDNLSYVAQLKPQAIVNSSIGAIQKLSKSLNIPLTVTSKDLMTDDVMKWLICKKNYVTAVESILNHSYLKDGDALYFTYLANGETKIGSINNEFNNPKDITYTYAKGKVDIVNRTIPMKDTNALIYFDFDVSRSAAITHTLGSSAVTMGQPLKDNKKSSATIGVTPSSSKNKAGMVGGVAGNNETINTKNSNTHDNYGIAPLIRDSVYARFSNKLTLSSSAENVVNIGDVINVMVPTYATESSDNAIKYSKALSGKYMVVSKTYSYGGINTFQFISSIDLISDNINQTVNNKDMFSNFGVKESDIK